MYKRGDLLRIDGTLLGLETESQKRRLPTWRRGLFSVLLAPAAKWEQGHSNPRSMELQACHATARDGLPRVPRAR